MCGRREGATRRTAQSALTVSLKSVVCGLTSIIVVVVSAVSLQLQGEFVPISLRPVLLPSWLSLSSCRSLLPPGGGFSIYRAARRTRLRILSVGREEEIQVVDFV